MYRIFTIALLILSQQSFSQQLTLKGKIRAGGEDKKIYYCYSKEKFDSKKFIQADKNNEYVFKASIPALQKASVEKIFFATDPASNPTNEYACVQTVNFAAILKDEVFAGKKEILLETDLRPDNNCESGIAEPPAPEAQKFVGQYILTIKDTSYAVNVKLISYGVSATANPVPVAHMSTLSGGWYFYEKDNGLTITLSWAWNDNFGIMKYLTGHSYKFIVEEKDGKLNFTNPSVPGATLKKLP